MVFVAVLVVMRYVLRIRVSIFGSLAVSLVVWLVIDQLNRRRRG